MSDKSAEAGYCRRDADSNSPVILQFYLVDRGSMAITQLRWSCKSPRLLDQYLIFALDAATAHTTVCSEPWGTGRHLVFTLLSYPDLNMWGEVSGNWQLSHSDTSYGAHRLHLKSNHDRGVPEFYTVLNPTRTHFPNSFTIYFPAAVTAEFSTALWPNQLSQWRNLANSPSPRNFVTKMKGKQFALTLMS